MVIQQNDLEEVLDQLVTAPRSISLSKLYALSDLNHEKLALFRDAWESFPVDLRRHLLATLLEFAEASFEVNFDAIFRYALDDPDDIVRATAIDGLWESEDIRLIGPFLTKLRADPSVEVRAAAASGLGRFVLAGELEKLEQPIQARIMTDLLTTIRLADESIDVRRRAIESIGYACLPEISDALELAYYDEDEKMRISAVVGMGRSCDKRWKHIVLEEMESTSTAMRYEAVHACGELALPEGVPLLARILEDPDHQIRYAAIWALGQIGGDQSKQLLLAAYDDADEDTEAALDEALAEHALTDGDLDFLLYEIDGELDFDSIDDDFVSLWSADDQDEEDLDGDDW